MAVLFELMEVECNLMEVECNKKKKEKEEIYHPLH